MTGKSAGCEKPPVRYPNSTEFVDSIDTIRYHPEDDVFRAPYDSSRDEPSLAVVAVLAAVDRRDPLELSSLFYTLDTDALDALFDESTSREGSRPRISFYYEGFEVVVFGEDVIEVSPLRN
ncbi:HalOD1 output domain-containing protein [Haloprofundus salilacus]|uniref:HalOD1 output domain-containing protein n=1 Tax=Haloprofundus salilacus TaxID=2876190 RepID=UPI001CC9CDC5|nr:HalOD1 output domain-containing protein [Haloprofundus salilacus]